MTLAFLFLFLNKIIDWHFSRLDLLIHDKTTQTVNSYMYIRVTFWQTSIVFKYDRYLMNFKNHFYAIYFSTHAWNLIYSKLSCAYETIVPADQYFSKYKKKRKIQSRGKGPVPMHTADDRFLLECI